MNKPTVRNDQAGVVSITVTMILMIVISITVLSFAQIIRREQREALDNQLSSQAFYAAETGINDAQNFIKEQAFTDGIPEKSDCISNAGPYKDMKNTVDSETGSSYTCLLVDPSPDSLEYELSAAEGSKVFPIKPLVNNAANSIKSIQLTWKAEQGGSVAGCDATLSAVNPTPPNRPCGYAMLRLDLAPVDSPYASRVKLNEAVFGLFAVPTTSGANTTNYEGDRINRSAARCDGSICTLSITNLPNNNDNYFMRVGALYRNTKLTVTALNSGGSPIELKDSQIKIDSTGRAQDVLRRIQVRVPLTYQGLHAENAITSNEAICKRFPTFYTEDPEFADQNANYNNNTAGC